MAWNFLEWFQQKTSKYNYSLPNQLSSLHVSRGLVWPLAILTFALDFIEMFLWQIHFSPVPLVSSHVCGGVFISDHVSWIISIYLKLLGWVKRKVITGKDKTNYSSILLCSFLILCEKYEVESSFYINLSRNKKTWIYMLISEGDSESPFLWQQWQNCSSYLCNHSVLDIWH